MSWYGRSFKGRVPRCLAIAFAAIAVLMTPVEYRAGADLPHPHAMLQLIYEASRGIPLHHHAVSYDREVQHSPLDTHGLTQGHENPDSSATHAGTMFSGPDIAQQADASLAVVVKMFTALAPVIIALPPAWVGIRGQVRDILALRGISLAPETPPPQG